MKAKKKKKNMSGPVSDIQSQAATLIGDSYLRGYSDGLSSGVERGRSDVSKELTELRSISMALIRHLEYDCVPTRNAEQINKCRERLKALGIDPGESDETLQRAAQAKAALLQALPGVRVPSKHFGEVIYTSGELQCAAFIGADGEVRISSAGEPASMRKEFARLCEAWGEVLRSANPSSSPDKTSSMSPIN